MTVARCAYKPNRSHPTHWGERDMEGEIQTASAGALWGAYLKISSNLCKLCNNPLARRSTSVKLSSNPMSRRLNCVTISNMRRHCLRTGRFKCSPLSGEGRGRWNSNGFRWRALGSSFAFLASCNVERASQFARRSTSVKQSSNLKSGRRTCVTVSHVWTCCLKTERFTCSPLHGDGWGTWKTNSFCWRALGSILDHSFALLASCSVESNSQVARGSKSVKLESNLLSRKLKFVTSSHSRTLCLQTERSKCNPLRRDGCGRWNQTTSAGGIWRT